MTNKKIGRPERRTTDIRKAQIVDAAMRIIASKGSRKFTAKLLGNEIGVTDGAIFRHYGTMDEIIDAVIQRIEGILFAGFPPSASDPIERLGIFFRSRVRAIVENPHVSRLMLSDHLEQAGGDSQARRLNEFKQRSQHFVLECLREAQKSGMLRRDVSPEEGAILVIGSVFALAHSKNIVLTQREIEQPASRIWSLIEFTLRGRDNDAALAQQTHGTTHPSRLCLKERRFK